MKSEYYYSQMTRLQQSVYRQIYDGMTQLSPSFSVTALPMAELSDLWFRLRLDHPMIFYVTSFRCRKTAGADTVLFEPEYMFEKKKILEHQKNLEARITRLIRPMQSLSGPEKAIAIHDFICSQVTYDKLKKGYSHEIIGPLQQGIGVCEGIAKTVKCFCDRLGIDCIIAICEADPERGNPYRHAWNIWKPEKTWYQLDATFDNSISCTEEIRYDYMNLSDRMIFRDHRPVIYPLPPCLDGDHFYYREKKLSFTKMEDVKNRIRQAIRKKKPRYTFHWRGGYLNREILQELATFTQAAADEKGLHAGFHVNYTQGILSLRLEEKKAEAIFSIDEDSMPE